jgi:hypothetical protein
MHGTKLLLTLAMLPGAATWRLPTGRELSEDDSAWGGCLGACARDGDNPYGTCDCDGEFGPDTSCDCDGGYNYTGKSGCGNLPEMCIGQCARGGDNPHGSCDCDYEAEDTPSCDCDGGYEDVSECQEPGQDGGDVRLATAVAVPISALLVLLAAVCWVYRRRIARRRTVSQYGEQKGGAAIKRPPPDVASRTGPEPSKLTPSAPEAPIVAVADDSGAVDDAWEAADGAAERGLNVVQLVELIRKELGIAKKPLVHVMNEACEKLGVPREGGLVGQARACWDALHGTAQGPGEA